MTAGLADRRRVSIVLPAYNEEDGIGQVITELKRALKHMGGDKIAAHEILVVDDGSDDRTAEIAEANGARVLRHPTNIGYGKALLTGFAAARHDWILMMDADGSYPPADIAELLAPSPDFDMVIGARQGSFFWGSPARALLRRCYLVLAGFVAGYTIPDANSGLRLIRKSSILSTMPVLCYGYSFSTTMTLSFLQAGKFVAFVPVSYRARKGRSKVSLVRDILRTLQTMVQVILYYNPLKFAVVLTLVPLVCSALFVFLFARRPSFGPLAMLAASLLGALGVFLAGCLLEAQRLHRR